MDWVHVQLGLFDELAKIAAVDLRGLSPETLMAQQPPEPMMTVGYDKAKAILDRAQMMKTAASRQIQRALPQRPGLGKLVHQGDDSSNERAKSVAGYGLAGASTGGLLHKVYSSQDKIHAGMRAPGIHPDAKYLAERANNTLGRHLMVGGAALGAGYGLYRAHQKAKARDQMQKISNIGSPAQALKASSQVGKHGTTPSTSGPSIHSQINGSLIGRKFTTPGV